MSHREHAAVRLAPFNKEWAATVLGWAASAEDLFHWSARRDFPLTDPAVFDLWQCDPEMAAYVLMRDEEIVAYGEIWLDATDGSAELGRLIVSPHRRRQGFCKRLIEQLIAVAGQTGCRQVWVRLFPTNIPALRCYESARFVRVGPEQEESLNASQRFRFVWMELKTGSSLDSR